MHILTNHGLCAEPAHGFAQAKKHLQANQDPDASRKRIGQGEQGGEARAKEHDAFGAKPIHQRACMDGKQERQQVRGAKDKAKDKRGGVEGIGIKRNDHGAHVKDGRGEKTNSINGRLGPPWHIFGVGSF